MSIFIARNIPNVLTGMRILLIPIFVLVFYFPVHWGHFVAAMIFIFAAVTDWFDGWLARILKQISPLGSFLDPVADKMIIVVALVLVVGEKYYDYLTIPAAIIVCREIVISALREWMAELGNRSSVAVSWIGKTKTAVQMLALVFLLVYQPGSGLWIKVGGYLLLYVAAILTCWSMFIYLQAAWQVLRKGGHV